MKTHISIFKALFLSALVLTTVSCKYELVSEPTRESSSSMSSADYGDTIQPPAKVTASQGNYRSVTLSWDVVKNATQYQIFSADTPYDTFVQEGETAGKETSFTVENELTGITKYYLVKAVNYYGTVSKGSKIVTATTMDAPIITDIDPSSEGNSVTVHWWMGNCTEATYAKNIQFKVTAYDSSKIKVPGAEVTVEGFADGKVQDSTDITNLAPSSDYYFTVEAVLKDSNQKSEKSDYTNAETAHRVNPDKVENLTITQGEYTDKIILNWQLPSPVEYRDRKTMVYSVQPVFFTIKRKEANADDSTYKVIESYIGAYGASGIVFDCSNNSSNNEKLTVTKDENGTSPLLYPKYTSLSSVTYTDTKDIVRGKKYTYLIQSYTDQAAEKNTSEETSVAIENGWKLPLTTFKLNNIPSVSEDGNTITRIDVSFNLDFEENDVSYTYVITENRSEFNVATLAENEKVLYQTNSLSDINSETSSKAFTNPADANEQGKYSYVLYILKRTDGIITEVPSEYIESLPASDEVTVTDDAHAIPTIENFEVADGYKDRFILTWNEIVSTAENPVTYTVTWIPFVEGAAQSQKYTILQSTNPAAEGYYTTSAGKVTYIAPAASGDVRWFTLKAVKNGIPDTKSYSKESKTLGTASPSMTDAQYKSIIVKWPEVQMADTDYVITAKYGDNTNAIAETPVITTDENGIVTCVIENPVGYDDITKSGLDVALTVKAINSTTGDYTEAPITVRTLGPAKIGTKANTSSIQVNRLSVNWNQIEDATGYIIYRTKYNYNNDFTNWTFERADKYYYDAAANTISINGSTVAGKRAKITLINGVYTLTDYDAVQDDITSSYEGNQAQISWGLPFGYVVLPVNGSDKDFVFGEDSLYLNVVDGESKVIYKNNFTDQKIATYGYGFNVAAQKSESADKVTVEWAKPYYENLIPTLYKMPFNKSPDYDYGANWTLVTQLAEGSTSYDDTIATDDISSAFVYAVQYEAPKTSNFNAAYRAKLLSTTDTRYTFPDKAEQLNKGYLLTLKDFSAVYGGTGKTAGDKSYYQENVTWDKNWDYEERALAPDSFTIELKNRNLSSTMNWTKIANGSMNNGILTATAITGFDDTTVTEMTSSDGITLRPTGLTAGTKDSTSDLLMVLRDAKHYYSVTLTRGDKDSVRQAEDGSIYAYRQITKEELGKCVALNIADAVYKTGIPDRKIYTVDGSTGTFRLACSDGVIDANRIQWELTKYTTLFAKGCSADTESLESFITLNSQSSSFSSKGISSNTLYYLPALDITVTSTVPLSSYSGVINFTAGAAGTSQKLNITMSKDGSQICSVSNNSTEYYKWMPYDLGSKHASADSTVNTSLKTYQSPWWN